MRSTVYAPDEVDSAHAILARAAESPDTPESQTLVKAALAVIANQNDITVSELCALSPEGLDLVDAFVQDRLSGRYDDGFLQTLCSKLLSMPQ
jgi:hypothetical protein